VTYAESNGVFGADSALNFSQLFSQLIAGSASWPWKNEFQTSCGHPSNRCVAAPRNHLAISD
jgi:hypothetical protein